MNLLEILLIGLVLSVDSFSAALAMGARNHSIKDSLKFALFSGGAEALAAGVGAMSGTLITYYLDEIDHWIAFILLILVAINLFKEGYEDLIGKNHLQKIGKEFHGNIKLLVVAVATSLDALAVGVGLGSTGKTILPYIISIGLWASVSTIVGMYIAQKISKKIGSYFHFVAAIILVMLGINFLNISN